MRLLAITILSLLLLTNCKQKQKAANEGSFQITFKPKIVAPKKINLSYHNDYVSYEKTEKDTIIKKDEVLSISLPLDQIHEAYYSISGHRIQLIVEPRDNFTIEQMDFESGDFKFNGHGSEKNTLLFDYFNFLINNGLDKNNLKKTFQSLSKEQALRIIDSYDSLSYDFLNGHALLPKISEEFREYMDNEIKYTQNNIFYFYNHFLKNNKNDSIDLEAIQDLDTTRVENPDAFTNQAYIHFVNYYISTQMEKEKNEKPSPLEKISYVENHFENSDVIRFFKLGFFIKCIGLDSNYTIIDSLYNDYKITMKNYPAFQDAEEAYLRSLNLRSGVKAPDFKLQDQKKNIKTLADFENKIKFIYFWSSKSGPSIGQANPFSRMVKAYTNSDKLQFINVGIEPNRLRWKSFAKRLKIKGFPLYCPGMKADAVEDYQIKRLPAVFMINEEDLIIKKAYGAQIDSSFWQATKTILDSLTKK